MPLSPEYAAQLAMLPTLAPMVPLSPEQEDLFARQVARWQDPQTHVDAQSRAERAGESLAASGARTATQARQARTASTAKARVHWLRQVAKTFGDAVEPHSACRARCSACCHQSVLLTETEAKVLSRELGLSLAQPTSYQSEPATRFQGAPCVFLENGACSIYAARPMACRLLFNMDADDLLCRIIPGSPVNVPYANTSQLHMLYLEAHIGKIQKVEDPVELASRLAQANNRLKMADIREFFPHGRREVENAGTRVTETAPA